MKIEKKVTPPVEPVTEYVLTLNRDEAMFLKALTDFPRWSVQSDDVRWFLEALYDKLLPETNTSAGDFFEMEHSVS